VNAFLPGGTEKVIVSVVSVDHCSVNEMLSPTLKPAFTTSAEASKDASTLRVWEVEKVKPLVTLLE